MNDRTCGLIPVDQYYDHLRRFSCLRAIERSRSRHTWAWVRFPGEGARAVLLAGERSFAATRRSWK